MLWNPKEDVTNRSLYKKEELQIAKGDRLVALANMNHLEIKNGTKFIVSDIGDNHVKLTSNKKSFRVSLKDLHESHLDYNYATTFSKHAKKETSHILADVKAYFLDKSTYSELTRRAKDTLTIFRLQLHKRSKSFVGNLGNLQC